MNIYVTYSNELYAQTRDFSAKMAKRLGRFDKVVVYTPADISEDFYKANARILETKSGAGLWLWKPYILLKALKEEAQEEDFVFYGDAGSFFIRNCRHIIRRMKSDIWVSDISLVERQYTKEYAFQRMGCEDDIYRNTPQVQANFVCVRKSKESLDFVEEWLSLCCDFNLISGNPEISQVVNDPKFIEHRMDQSILSLLSKKRKIEIHLDPSQYGRFPEKYHQPDRLKIFPKHQKEYPVCIILHRTKNVEFRICFKQIMNVLLPKRMVKLLLSKNHA